MGLDQQGRVFGRSPAVLFIRRFHLFAQIWVRVDGSGVVGPENERLGSRIGWSRGLGIGIERWFSEFGG